MKAKPSPQQQRLASAACARKARRSCNTQHSIRICTLRIGTLYGHQGWDWISTAVAQTIKRIVQCVAPSGRGHQPALCSATTVWATHV